MVHSNPEILEQLARLCRDNGSLRPERKSVSTGHKELDALLPEGGWPLGAITELLIDTPGLGELEILLPALRQLAHDGKHIVWISPPLLPYAPALAERGLPLERQMVVRTADLGAALWAMEQALRCPAVGAVLGWPAQVLERNLRRLQLAAEAGGNCAILYRPGTAAEQTSPAALRLRLQCPQGEDTGTVLTVHKARGGRAGTRLRLAL